MSSLEKAILNTIIYFDIFDFPLTLIEIWKWLLVINNDELLMNNEKTKISDILKALETSERLKKVVDTKQGFYFLKGREDSIKIRQERYLISQRKFKKTLSYVKNYFRYFPHIKFIGICNTLAFSHSRDKADIDFFIITKKGKVWSVRESIVMMAQFFDLRPTDRETKDRFCFTFFVDEENMNLENMALKPKDHYLTYWINQIVPVYDEGGFYERFLEENKWTRKFLPNAIAYQVAKRRRVDPMPWGFKYTFLTWESFSKFWQQKVMSEKLKKLANQDSRVIISDSVLKFHSNDRRAEFGEKFEKKKAIIDN